MSLLTMVTQSARRLGIPAPASVSSSQNEQVIQLMAIANEEGQDLSARYPWTALQNESTFVTVAAESQGAISTLAGAGFRYILNDVMWNRTLLRPVFGPLVPSDWQMLKARNVNGPYNQFRIRGQNVLFIPAPAAGQNIYFEWISKYWVNGTSSTWNNDADTSYLDEEIMAQGIIWRWQAFKGIEYAESFNKYERLVVDAMARDGGKSRLNLGGGFNNWPAGVVVPLGSWSV